MYGMAPIEPGRSLTPCCGADEPGKPGNVELTDWDKDHADLKWTKPESDGGAPITGYIIEYKVRAALPSAPTCLVIP